ncbi:MAG: UbiD family decarboxylase [Nitrososphaerota archaeon]
MAEDLREWIEQVSSLGLLKIATGADPELEIGVITELNAKSRKYTILFDEIKGHKRGFRLLVGSLIDRVRLALALGIPIPANDIDLVKAIKERLSGIWTKLSEYEPQVLDDAPFMENVKKGDEVDVTIFPAPKWHELDGGRYLGTADCVITVDPDSGWVNVGTYRVMVHGKRELGILFDTGHHGRFHMTKWLEKGKRCPVAISFGHHPLMFAVGGLEVPFGISEYNYAGALTGRRWKVVKGPITGLPIPYDSEVVVEGYIDGETKPEVPFGEFMGYYAGGVMENPVIKVEAVYYRENPIILGTAPGRPPYDYSYYRCPFRAAMIWDALEKAGIPNVVGVWCHEAGYSRAFTVVSIRQSYAGHARQAGYVAAMCRPGAYAGRFVVVVDEDIDPTNLNDVVWAMCSRTDPAEHIEIIRHAWGSPLDPIAEREPGMRVDEFESSRAIIFACWPYRMLARGRVPAVAESSKQITQEIREKWKWLFE